MEPPKTYFDSLARSIKNMLIYNLKNHLCTWACSQEEFTISNFMGAWFNQGFVETSVACAVGPSVTMSKTCFFLGGNLFKVSVTKITLKMQVCKR